MADAQDQVEKANSEFKALLADLKGHRESSFLIRLTESLVKMTGTDEDAEAIENANKPDPVELQRQELRKRAQEMLDAAAKLH